VSPFLAVRDLSTTFVTHRGEVVHAVEGVSFDLERGELLALVGESGSGKTTLALSLLRLIPDPPGRVDPAARVLLDGIDVLRLDGQALRRVRGGGIGYVFQEPGASLNPVLPIGTQIVETMEAHSPQHPGTARRRAAELLAAVGLSDPSQHLNQYPHELSGGMQQRAMIAIALAGNPSVLIADEPTTALDVTIQAQILGLLTDLKQRLGLAVLFITHDLSVAAGLADRIAVMYAGRIVETAPTLELFDHPAHPYTEALLSAVPRVDQPAKRLQAIPGQPPSAARWPTGCAFHPRCSHAWERCSTAPPPLLSAGADRQSRCWLVEEPERRTS
jgi:oligopeptide transport system ATP-binding protein